MNSETPQLRESLVASASLAPARPKNERVAQPAILTSVPHEDEKRAAAKSVFSAKVSVLLAYVAFGLMPIYWKSLHRIAPEQVFFHRVFGSAMVLLLISAGRKEITSLVGRCDRKNLLMIAATALMIGANWFTYLRAIDGNQLSEASLGYFLCPLFSIALGIYVCGERISGRDSLALACMLFGVAIKVMLLGALPLIAIFLGLSFSLYSLLHQRMKLSAQDGLLLETMALTPLVYAFALWKLPQGASLFYASSLASTFLLYLAGPLTALPMLLLLHGAKKTSMRFVGTSQYLAPSISLCVATLLFGESFAIQDGIIFAAIWLGVALFISARHKPPKFS